VVATTHVKKDETPVANPVTAVNPTGDTANYTDRKEK
jgi:hypothetical protein